MGVEGLHSHDLRHTGNLLAAQTPETTLRDLMARMGHDSMRAALIYQHATLEADRHIAESMGKQLALLRPDSFGEDDGATTARDPSIRPANSTWTARGHQIGHSRVRPRLRRWCR